MDSVSGALTHTVGLKERLWMSNEGDSNLQARYREQLGKMSVVVSTVQKGTLRQREVKQHVCLRSSQSKGQSWTFSQLVHLHKSCLGFRWVPHCFLPKAFWNDQIFKNKEVYLLVRKKQTNRLIILSISSHVQYGLSISPDYEASTFLIQTIFYYGEVTHKWT